HVQRQPVGRVRRAVGAAHDLEAHPIELPALDDGGFGDVGLVRRGTVRGEVVVRGEAFGGEAPEGAALGQRVLPQFLWRARVRIPAGHPDYRYGGFHGFWPPPNPPTPRKRGTRHES